MAKIDENAVKTIVEDDEDGESFSEESGSGSEFEFQPTKQQSKGNGDFDPDFEFPSTVEEYNHDPWKDLMTKYVKRKASTKTDDIINKVRAEIEQASDEDEEEDMPALKHEDEEFSLSEDELKPDNIKVKEKKGKRKASEAFQKVDLPTEEDVSFLEMNLSRPLLIAINKMNFINPTPIQVNTIPVALLGKDICACAATGTGKTAAYMLPTLERLLFRPMTGSAVTRVLVLVPTRELGCQVYEVTRQLSQFTNIRTGLAVGGLDLKAQAVELRKNPDIVIATPGRLIDHLKSTPSFGLESIEVLILDEADRMLDNHFAEQMKDIIKQCSRKRQTMLFSATMKEEVEDLAAVSLVEPVRLFVDSNQEVAFNLRQEFVRIRDHREADREAILAALVCRIFREHCMIFVQTKKQAHRLHILLGLLGLKVAELHGNLTQPQRLESLRRFKDKEVDILVATDVAGRGLDIHGVQTVINFVMPLTLEHYIHRVGRTARAGRVGVSVSLAGESDRKIVKQVVKHAKNPVKSRVIPKDVLAKYTEKLQKFEPQIAQILQQESEEQELKKVENQVNRAEKILKGEIEPRRPWFQTKKQRQEEKERLKLSNPSSKKVADGKANNKKKGKNKKNTEEDNKVKNLVKMQARLAKKQQKQKKLYKVQEDVSAPRKRGQGKKRKSLFDVDLSDVSAKKAKMLRHQGASQKKEALKNKNSKGKVFGKPQQKKRRK